MINTSYMYTYDVTGYFVFIEKENKDYIFDVREINKNEIIY
jgi:hypothetical protein